MKTALRQRVLDLSAKLLEEDATTLRVAVVGSDCHVEGRRGLIPESNETWEFREIVLGAEGQELNDSGWESAL